MIEQLELEDKTSPYYVSLSVFEGPLDLLLHLIRENNVDIFNIPISNITDQYMAYIETMETLNLDIAGEFLLEAAVIGLLGGAIGFLLGWGVAGLLNLGAAQALGGTEIFKITPRLAAIAIGFAVVLGVGAGLLPAWGASRLDPVIALREEA